MINIKLITLLALNFIFLFVGAQVIERGPNTKPVSGGSSSGMGRINCIAFDPDFTSNSTMYCGSAVGGVWKSTDAGDTWFNLNTDQLPVLSVSHIIVNPQNTDNIYISTGDADRPFGGGYGGGNEYSQSRGIYESTNGGITWSPLTGNWQDIDDYPTTSPPNMVTHNDFWEFPSKNCWEKLPYIQQIPI